MKFSTLRVVFFLSIACFMIGCTRTIPSDPSLTRIDKTNLPVSDTAVTIPGLSFCTSSTDPMIHLNSREPVNIIVHGCAGSAALFRSLAQVFAFHGQQTLCFNYNDRDSLMKSSKEFIKALNSLVSIVKSDQITIIGHSQGGLVSRKALIKERDNTFIAENNNVRLVTISAPFAGITAADHCASLTARILTLGLSVPVCKLLSGDKWYEITRPSPFIQEPGEFIPQVISHLKIVTDEEGTCRRYDNEVCVEDDFVFSINEQYFEGVDNFSLVENIEVFAGHSEIVGDYYTPPKKLIKLLQSNGIIASTPFEKREEFDVFLSQLYK